MTMSDEPAGAMHVLSEFQCLELLASRDLGRVSLVLGDQPEIFPVNYTTDGDIVIFRTSSSAKLAKATSGRISFEVDDWNATTGVGWSVMVKGVAQEVTSGVDPFAAALRSRSIQALAPGERQEWIAIYPSEISGRRFHRLPTAPRSNG
jgi:nitroimidazol reductase NimA-like FMN-containing flavoprotein (pyridoxamine 5'-phosphate oxidase superfamily)